MSESYADRMARIMVSDHERHMTRQAREDALLSHDDESRAALADWHDEPPLLHGLGMIQPPRKYPRAIPRTRSVGVAAASDNPEHIARLAACDVNPSVRVIRDGVETIVPASDFRHGARQARQAETTQSAETPETARIELRGMDWSQ